MKFDRFEDIIAWQKAKDLNMKVYSAFSEMKDFNFRNQIQRAAVSVMNNIAEGFERSSNNEFKYFLYIAKGSSGEVRSMVILAKELNFINQQDYELIYNLSNEISMIISGLIKKI